MGRGFPGTEHNIRSKEEGKTSKVLGVEKTKSSGDLKKTPFSSSPAENAC